MHKRSKIRVASHPQENASPLVLALDDVRTRFEIEHIEALIFKGSLLAAVGPGFHERKSGMKSVPLAVRGALRTDGPSVWTGAIDEACWPIAPPYGSENEREIPIGRYLFVPFRLEGQITILWQIYKPETASPLLRLDVLEKLCGNLFLLSCQLRKQFSGAEREVLPADISSREIEILHWCALGKTYGEISSILQISSKTVDYHMSKIMRKLDVNDKLSAILKAARFGLIDID